MLIGHNDGFLRDKNMKVTAMYNHFGPNCNQRMPRYLIDPPHSRNSRHKPGQSYIYELMHTSILCRIRFGYAHVVNNLYQGWTQYAIGRGGGGSMNPCVKSQANLFNKNAYTCTNTYTMQNININR